MLEGSPSVVVIEDEREIRRFVRGALEAEGCRVFDAATGVEGLECTGARATDLVVLDLGLPDRDGMDVIRDLRAWSAVPILVLSARAEEDDKIDALDAGADDYLSKPFGIGELLARARALLRRRPRLGEASPALAFGDVVVDFSRRIVQRAGAPVHLTPIEYRLLGVLVANADRVLTHRQLLREVWGAGHAQSGHYLRVYVAHLRRKLEADAARPKHILTETGIGYRFRA